MYFDAYIVCTSEVLLNLFLNQYCNGRPDHVSDCMGTNYLSDKDLA